GAVLSWLVHPTLYTAGGLALRRALGGLPQLSKPGHLYAFIACSLLIPAAVALLLITIFCVDGIIPWAEFWYVVPRFVIGDALGIVTLTPVCLLIGRPVYKIGIGHPVLVFSTAIICALVILYVEVSGLLLGGKDTGLSYLLLIPVAWNAITFGLAGAAFSTALINVSVVLASWLSADHGVAANSAYFMLSVGYVCLIIAGTVERREAAMQELRRQKHILDRAYSHFANYEAASKLAHEIRQPLASATAYIGGLREIVSRSGTSEVSQLVRRIEEETNRISAILKGRQNLLNASVRLNERVSVNETLTEILPLLKQIAIDHRVLLETSFSSQGLFVMGDKTALQQVIVNLLKNSCEAIGDLCQHRKVAISTVLASDTVLITVEDSGPGFPQDVLEQGHALFASNKVGGSGFGLPISAMILNLMEGRMELSNTPNGGMVTVRLPAA
ncbi:MAG TPA: ATP-binding protein, partial [Ferrovibrio sp.]|uniref:ATP-binding protein n=1 Tax=Ferrovibrio sp. TaxID=1917215 RepID=UPI002ED1C745